MSQENLPYLVLHQGQDGVTKEKFHSVVALFMSRSDMRKFMKVCGNPHYVECPHNPQPEMNAVAKFHIERGCCDGTDPIACHKKRDEEEQKLRDQLRADRRREREDEYEGTEASCFNTWHSRVHKMGEQCPNCGMIA